MPNFFVPGITNKDVAEQLYQSLARQSASNTAEATGPRLYQVGFRQGEQTCIARVGQPIEHWPKRFGIVIAITRAGKLIFVYTDGESGQNTICIGAHDAFSLLYFTDFASRKEHI